MNEFLEEKIHASVAKLGNRCFCWLPSAMLELIQVNTSKASLYYFNLSLSLGKTFLQIYRIGNIPLT